MKSDADIAAERETILRILGPVVAGWVREACHLEYGHNAEVLTWACRVRELARTTSRDLGALAEAAETLVRACGRLDDGGGERIRQAVEQVQTALWWRDG